MPFQLVEKAPCDFIDSIFESYRNQLAKFWPDEKIISLNDINKKNSSTLTRRNPTPSSSLISMIIQHSSIWDGMI
jgi:hypothetical protein